MPSAHAAASATSLPGSNYTLATVKDCETVYEALQAALDTVCGFMGRPRCDDGSASYSRLEDLTDWLMTEAEAVIRQAEAMAPTTRADANDRAQLLIKHEINCGSDASTIAALAAAVAAEVGRFRDAHH